MTNRPDKVGEVLPPPKTRILRARDVDLLPWVAAKMIPFPRRWHGGTISANLEAIWGMSVKEVKRLCKEFGFTSEMLKGALSEGRKKNETKFS